MILANMSEGKDTDLIPEKVLVKGTSATPWEINQDPEEFC